ncbi:MAG: CoA-binding protein [Phycisphaerales bacterium]
MPGDDAITQFLQATAFAVAGASQHREKFGNKVFRALLLNRREVFPINPSCDRVEGHACYPNLTSLPVEVGSLSIVTPPDATRMIVQEAIRLNIRNIWMQPGAEHDGVIADARAAGINVLAHGPCILVELARVSHEV